VSEVVAEAVRTAEDILRAAAADTTSAERRRARRLGRLLADDDGRELLFTLTDEVLRTPGAARAMEQLRALVRRGLPLALPIADRVALRAAALGSHLAPGPVAAVVRQRIRAETRGVIVPAAEPAFTRHVARRRREGFTTNVNLLGEAILGDDEADERLRQLLARMERPDVDYVSVKISALCANLDVLAFDAEVERISARLRTIYRAAAAAQPVVFVNLDMEEYRDLHLTVGAFVNVLDEPEFAALPAGIVLQAYLPDSHAVAAHLVAWAGRRHATGGGRVKVRLVKGANLAMEHVDAELGGWAPAPYATKAEVDASYKCLLDALVQGVRRGVTVGVGSHNLFDVGWALARRRREDLDEAIGIEMLEGMAPPQARATKDAAGTLLLYTPVVTAEDFAASIAYLSRRLDENAGPQNFLRSLFTITPDSPAWAAEQARFERAVVDRRTVSTRPRRTQDRPTERYDVDADPPFANEPDTDFTVAANRRWVAEHLAHGRPAELPALIDRTDGIDDVVARARAGFERWRALTSIDRRAVLARAIAHLAAGRGRTIAVMAHETGKTVREGDPEVSEAVDFTRWAIHCTRELDDLAADGVDAEPLGVVLVAGPWNFPLAIPCNGVVAALAAGNAVLLKPAPEAVATAVEIVRHLHAAGVPTDVLQLVRCRDDDVGRHLVTHDGVDGVVLTGSYETAQLFLGWKPSLHLLAETSGKNSLVITQTADLDLALHDLVRSAFGHAGQKCSAASLAVVEGQLYDDPAFHRRLADAVRSLRVGPATELTTMVGPVITRPAGKLARALTRLDPGERWLVEPRRLDAEADGRLWAPGVRVGVEPGSWFHHTECFGPVLGVMRADDLDHAIAIQNAVTFGLTGGIHALDAEEIEHWLDRVEVGNAYVNRHTTGAIVGRQPFGGWKRSSIGRGAKTGGPGDVGRFVRFGRRGPRPTLEDAAHSYQRWWQERFGIETDRSGLRAESNVLRYRPVGRVLVRTGRDTADDDVASLRRAAAVAGVAVEVVDPDRTDDEVAARLPGVDRLRLLTAATDALRAAAHRADVAVDETAITHDGRVELPCWLREQAISRTRHRHGRVVDRP
jgi:RHH-type proline utilization regulon transcriptional repressor/proline dehydrogenase/delta 1-pyrroline-5-carboxylate dehydrogenase